MENNKNTDMTLETLLNRINQLENKRSNGQTSEDEELTLMKLIEITERYINA